MRALTITIVLIVFDPYVADGTTLTRRSDETMQA